MCGNGTTEPGEDCDDGASNGMASDGCKADCAFACVNAATDCARGTGVSEADVQRVARLRARRRPDQQNDMPCGNNLVCNNGACVAPSRCAATAASRPASSATSARA